MLTVSYLVIESLSRISINSKLKSFMDKKNEEYSKELEKYYNKNKKVKLTSKINAFHKINILIDKASLERSLIINPVTIILSCILSFVICNLIAYSVLKIILLSLIIAIPGAYLPIFLLTEIADYNNSKIEKGMLDFLLQLKNYVQVGNDIIYAFSQVKTVEPLQSHINKFLVEVKSGIKFEKAIENIKEKITFIKLKNLFTNLEHCYLHGGNFKELLDKSYDMISKIQKEKKLRNQETKSARIILGVLIVLDLFVYFNFIKDNHENYIIMTHRLLGTLILYWNFISIWILIILMHKVKKLEY